MLQKDRAIDVDHLFDRFYKEDTARSDSQSSGLGLAIAKRIIQLHDGTIEVMLSGEEITFHIALPLSDCSYRDTMADVRQY
ncbi:MAG: cell wall metabolism sensor histidine kinase WalK [Firmicutes bacterium]|nr:cell wall metabolism sensor histidine kinase WalK [Bacillota bacterium]